MSHLMLLISEYIIRCDDLYFAFPRYKLPQREEAYDIPLHFLTVSLIIEVLKSIEEWSYKHFLNDCNKNEAKIAINMESITTTKT